MAVLMLLLLTGFSPAPAEYPGVREGDIVFQAVPHSRLSDAIEGMTHSPYSHCGIVERKAGGWFVIEAIGPVTETPLPAWIARSRDGEYAAYRLRPGLESKVVQIRTAALACLGRPYNSRFRFGEKGVYCSELVYEAVLKATGVRLGKVQRVGDLDWKPFEAYIKSREGSVPKDRELITPRAVSEAPELTEVFESEALRRLHCGTPAPAKACP
jgi:Permuted papain-like amidase enzyme, YaeF/YiiX, C92 family